MGADQGWAGGAVQARADVDLPADALTPAQARRFTSRTLESWGLTGLSDTACLLVSELTTNAVLHAHSRCRVVVELRGEVLFVAVCDGSPHLPAVRDYGVAATTGRGLRLVASCATAWGFEPVGTGKQVWFEIPVAGDLEAEPDMFFDVDAVDSL